LRLAVVYGNTVSWSLMAADYHVRMPAKTNKLKLAANIWACNFFGNVIPEVMGTALMTAVAADSATLLMPITVAASVG
jgi:purine-cytosine permease-like protein